ncbi:MAG: hypothetical protein R6U84_06735 [Candidatus Cloacimonadales bacterium]
MKKYLLPLLLILPLLLLAEELDLGDFIIEGKGVIAIDSLTSLQRFSAYNQIKQKDLLDYQTPYSARTASIPQQPRRDERGYLAVHLGEVLAADLQAGLLLPQSKWLGFGLSADFWEYEQDWNFQTAALAWQPYLETEYLSATIQKSQMQWNDGFLANQLAAGNFQFRTEKLAVNSRLQLDYLEVKTEVGAFDFELDDPTNVESSDQQSTYYEEFFIAAGSSKADLLLQANYAYIRANHLAEINLGWQDFQIAGISLLDQLSLNLWYEKPRAPEASSDAP